MMIEMTEVETLTNANLYIYVYSFFSRVNVCIYYIYTYTHNIKRQKLGEMAKKPKTQYHPANKISFKQEFNQLRWRAKGNREVDR